MVELMTGKRTGMASVLVALCVTLGGSDVQAQGVGTARYGQRFTSVGLSSQPGLIFDEDAPPTADHQDVMTSWGTLVVFGLHHYLHPHFSMAAELGLGLQWLDDHTIAPSGQSEAEKAFAWQIGLLGRYIPAQGLQGLSLGLGMHLFSARLDGAPMQQLAGEFRTGWLFWHGEKTPRFGLVEVGVSAPMVQGLRLPEQVVVLDGQEPPVVAPSNWSMWRGSVSIQVSF
jgi:hypothetical protein